MLLERGFSPDDADGADVRSKRINASTAPPHRLSAHGSSRGPPFILLATAFVFLSVCPSRVIEFKTGPKRPRDHPTFPPPIERISFPSIQRERARAGWADTAETEERK